MTTLKNALEEAYKDGYEFATDKGANADREQWAITELDNRWGLEAETSRVYEYNRSTATISEYDHDDNNTGWFLELQ